MATATDEAAAIELGEFKIRVNAISPGTINTPLLATAIEDSKLEQPIKDFGMPIDIAYTALFLASDESRFITGINLCVDGGLTLDNSGLMVDAAEHYSKMGIERVVGMNMGSTGIESSTSTGTRRRPRSGWRLWRRQRRRQR